MVKTGHSGINVAFLVLITMVLLSTRKVRLSPQLHGSDNVTFANWRKDILVGPLVGEVIMSLSSQV